MAVHVTYNKSEDGEDTIGMASDQHEGDSFLMSILSEFLYGEEFANRVEASRKRNKPGG
jgi:hypothetical protein